MFPIYFMVGSLSHHPTAVAFPMSTELRVQRTQRLLGGSNQVLRRTSIGWNPNSMINVFIFLYIYIMIYIYNIRIYNYIITIHIYIWSTFIVMGPPKKTSFRVISNSLVGLYFSKSIFFGGCCVQACFCRSNPLFWPGKSISFRVWRSLQSTDQWFMAIGHERTEFTSKQFNMRSNSNSRDSTNQTLEFNQWEFVYSKLKVGIKATVMMRIQPIWLTPC